MKPIPPIKRASIQSLRVHLRFASAATQDVNILKSIDEAVDLLGRLDEYIQQQESRVAMLEYKLHQLRQSVAKGIA